MKYNWNHFETLEACKSAYSRFLFALQRNGYCKYWSIAYEKLEENFH